MKKSAYDCSTKVHPSICNSFLCGPVFFLIIFIIVNVSVLAQPIDGIYTNVGQKNVEGKRINEMLYVKGHSVFWFTGNNNGIYTTSGYFGKSDCLTDGKSIIIYPENNHLARHTISIDRKKGEHNSIRLFFEGKQGRPMIFVSVFISKQYENDRVLYARTDKAGSIDFSNATLSDLIKKDNKKKYKQKKRTPTSNGKYGAFVVNDEDMSTDELLNRYLSDSITITLSQIEIDLKFETVLEKGYDYHIRCSLPAISIIEPQTFVWNSEGHYYTNIANDDTTILLPLKTSELLFSDFPDLYIQILNNQHFYIDSLASLHRGNRNQGTCYSGKEPDENAQYKQCISQPKTPEEIISCLSQTGNDTSRVLNECESKCLNYKFQKMRGSFDFNGKKVLFFRGNTGKVQVSKKWYFDVLKKSFEMSGRIDYEYVSTDWLFFFCAEEARLVGCDAVVFIACKKAPLSKQEVLKRIGKPILY